MGFILKQQLFDRLPTQTSSSAKLCKFYMIIPFLVVACSQPFAVAPEESVTDQVTPLAVPDRLNTAATEYVALRGMQGQFSGGVWTPEIDEWDGPKHRAMQVIGETLMARPYDRATILRLLGEPDERLWPADPLYDSLLAATASDAGAAELIEPAEILIYHWRGNHDYLYLLMDGETLLQVNWWHAGE